METIKKNSILLLFLLTISISYAAIDFTPSGSGTSPAMTPNLQEVTDVGASTTNSITAPLFSGALNWNNLQNYPSACPSGEYMTAVGDTLTCAPVTTTNATITASADEVVYYDGTDLAGTGIENDDLASKTYVQSRGQNLISNGKGQMLSNYNFDGYSIDRAQVVDAFGSFSIICNAHNNCNRADGTNSPNNGQTNDEYIPVDTDKTYVLKAWAKANTTVPTQYFGIVTYDSDFNAIIASTHMTYGTGYPNTRTSDTRLAQDLETGDTEVCLENATGWADDSQTYRRGFLFWNYTNDQGYTYEDYTYSRYYANNDQWDFGTNAINTTSNCITLNAPWSYANPKHVNGTWTSGWAVSQKNSGAAYKYIANPNPDINETWQLLQGSIGNKDLSGSNKGAMFPPGTAFVRLLFLNNFGGTEPIQQWFSSFYFGEAFATTELTVPGSDAITSLVVDNGDGDKGRIKYYKSGTDDHWGVNSADDTPNYPFTIYGGSPTTLWLEGEASATGYNTRTFKTNKTDKEAYQLVQYALANEYDTQGNYDHSSWGVCYNPHTFEDKNKPIYEKRADVELFEDENGNLAEREVEREILVAYENTTIKQVNIDCKQVMISKAQNHLTKEFDGGIAMFDAIYTKSKYPQANINYASDFKIEELEKKSTHYATTIKNGKEMLDMEERIVRLEGAMAQMVSETCLDNKKYSWCKK